MTITGFPLTSENYDHSLALLKERFGQSHKIVNAHMQSLLALPSPSNNLSSLRSFYDSVENHICGLSALGKSKDSKEHYLLQLCWRNYQSRLEEI